MFLVIVRSIIFYVCLSSPSCSILTSVLSKLVELVAAVDWESHGSHDDHDRHTSDKEEGVAS